MESEKKSEDKSSLSLKINCDSDKTYFKNQEQSIAYLLNKSQRTVLLKSFFPWSDYWRETIVI
jgi:hypothetical protein